MAPRLGILTGISYVSGVDYYRGIHERVLAATPVRHLMPPNPPMTLVSIDCDTYAHHLTEHEFERVHRHLLDGVDKLVATGCDLLVIASNTGHICVPAVEAAHPGLDILHIADCSAHKLRRLGVTTVGLVGTQPTMEQPYLKERLARHGITTITPNDPDARSEIYRIIYEELSLNEFVPASRDRIVAEIRTLADRGAAACILGCTEIELLVQQKHIPELPIIPSAETHIDVIADVLLGNAQLADVLPTQ